MKKLIASLIFLLATQFTFAQPNNNGSNASVGTKVLLERIEALEARLAAIDPMVAGHSYVLYQEANHQWINHDFDLNHGVSFSVGMGLLQFFDDGTGILEALSCDGFRSAFLWETFDDAPICQGTDLPFEYTQVGNNLEVTYTFPQGFTNTLNYLVSVDGGQLLRSLAYNRLDGPCDPANPGNGCLVDTAGARFILGLRLQ